MSQHDLALVFYGVGILGILLALVRTYMRVWKSRKAASQVAHPLPKGSQDLPKKSV